MVKEEQPVPCAGRKGQTQRGGRAEAEQERRRSWLDSLALALQLLHRACKYRALVLQPVEELVVIFTGVL